MHIKPNKNYKTRYTTLNKCISCFTVGMPEDINNRCPICGSMSVRHNVFEGTWIKPVRAWFGKTIFCGYWSIATKK